MAEPRERTRRSLVRRVVWTVEWIPWQTEAHLPSIRKSDVGWAGLVRGELQVLGLDLRVPSLIHLGLRARLVGLGERLTGANADIKTVAIKKKRIIPSPNGIDLLEYSMKSGRAILARNARGTSKQKPQLRQISYIEVAWRVWRAASSRAVLSPGRNWSGLSSFEWNELNGCKRAHASNPNLSPGRRFPGAIFWLQPLNTPTRPGDDAPRLDKTPQ